MLLQGRFEPVAPAGDDASLAASSAGAPDVARSPSSLKLVDPRPGTDFRSSSRHAGTATLAATPATDPGWRQIGVLATRALRLLSRDPGLVLVILAQPAFMGLLVALAQYNVARNEISRITFFAVVVAIWLGLNNSARDLVRERRQYVRDRLAGLSPTAYLGAKAAVHAAIGAVQVLILLAVLRVGCGLVVERGVPEVLREAPWGRIGAVLMLCHLGGVGLGLLASSLVRTEESAVAVLPLLILPQLLISAVATGTLDAKPRPFRPLAMTLGNFRELRPPAVLLDVLSMGCLSRPAALVAEAPMGGGGVAWVGDLCHLLILIMATWALVFLAFGRAERRWLRLMDL